MGVDNELGPQDEGDAPFEARMRLHQSWYRARVLGLPHGEAVTADGHRPLGSVLPRQHAAEGRNFLHDAIFDVARRRIRAGGGVEPFACLSDMCSSQPLWFNLWAPLVEDTELATRLLASLVDDVERVVEVHIAHAPAPRSEYLGERAAFDAFIGYVSTDGSRAFLATLTRLTHAGSRPVDQSEHVRALLDAPDAPWRPEQSERLADPALAPLWRTHLLAEALRCHPAEPYQRGRCVVVRHPADPAAAQGVADYRACLREPDLTLADWPLDDLVARWARTGTTPEQREWLAALRLRYVDLHHSDGAVAGGAPRPEVAAAGER